MKRGLGPRDLNAIEVLGEELKNFIAKDFKIPGTTFLKIAPKWVIDGSKWFLKMKPALRQEKCKLCGLCVKSCPAGAMELQEGRISINGKKCILCLCCQEICPHGAIEIKKNFLLELMSKLRS